MKDDISRLAIYSHLTEPAKEVKANMRPLVEEIMHRLLDAGAPEEALPAGILILISALAEEMVGRQLITPGIGITVRHGTAESMPEASAGVRRRKKHKRKKRR